MVAGHKRNGSGALVFLGVLTFVLAAGALWSFSIGDVAAGSLRLDEIQICEELDGNLKPINSKRNLPGETQQVCLWFQYSRAVEGDSLEISWYLDEKLIQREVVSLSSESGIRAFYLLKEDASPLDAGFYSVLLACDGREKGMENFTVAALEGDYPEGGDEFLDY
ncbi:MAG: hypothetical protein LBS75_05820 [Synergistaceae bacterium]|jgi:hypothetical protein|nr:hypothetical protein [Synergistaceae bacterium]